MTQEELYSLLKTIEIPIAERVFPEKQIPPFAVYYCTGNDNLYADNTVYNKSKKYVLEVYSDYKMPETEERVEAIFNENEIPYTVSETYLSEERLREIIYEFKV